VMLRPSIDGVVERMTDSLTVDSSCSSYAAVARDVPPGDARGRAGAWPAC
jgi:hypothetical protein